jgi:quercetin dioxygenase-like cupin family protein
MPGPLRVEVLLGAEDTGGAFCMLADYPQPGWGLPPHSHANESETIYVIEGRFSMIVDGEPVQLGPGDVAHVPMGVTHSGSAAGEGPGHRVIVFSPAGMEDFFVGAGSPDEQAAPDLQKLLTLAGEHGWSFGE